MARTKQAHKSASVPKRPKRATFKTGKSQKRDPTPEPSHPENPCPSQVIGDSAGCNLCYPEMRCKPGERQLCRRVWADTHFRISKALQSCRQQHQQLEDDVKKLRAQGYSNNLDQQIATTSNPNVGPITSTPKACRSEVLNKAGPRNLCRTCNAPIEDGPSHQQGKRRHSTRFFFQGAWQQPQLQCFDCRVNGGPGSSSQKAPDNYIGNVKREPDEMERRSHANKQESNDEDGDNVIIISSSTERNLGKEDQNIYSVDTCSEASSDDEMPVKDSNVPKCSSTEDKETNKIRCTVEKMEFDEGPKHDANLANLEQQSSDLTGSWNVLSQNNENNVPNKQDNNDGEEEDWRKRKPTALAQFRYLLESQLFCDCCLSVTCNGESNEFPCHKLVLARASSAFASMLYGPNANTGVIYVDGIPAQAVRLLLGFIYSDRVAFESVESALDVCAAAQRYKIHALSSVCCLHIARQLSPSSVCRVIDFATSHELQMLLDACIQMLRERTKEVLDSASFLSSPLSIVELILQQDNLNISSELCLVTACEAWAKLHKPDSNASTIETLGPVRQLFRFLSLSANQFAQGPAQSDILTQEEKLAIFVALASYPSDQQCVLPSDLSINRLPRCNPQVPQHDFLQSD